MIQFKNRRHRAYPNISDMMWSPTFFGVKSGSVNRFCHFWNLIGAREKSSRRKFTCEVCENPMRKRVSDRKYMVCKKCLHRYIVEVKNGTREPVFHVPLVAVQ